MLILYYEVMVVGPASHEVRIDELASMPGEPYGIITVDGQNPHEIDDGISVTPLDTSNESYQVRVFSADTSGIYRDPEQTRRVLELTESRYRQDGPVAEQYEPMLPQELVRSIEFKEGRPRRALVVSFAIGPNQPPSDIEIGFGRVEVLKNWDYQNFGKQTRRTDQHFQRAAGHVLNHLWPKARSDVQTVFEAPEIGAARRGANVNTAFMIAANHLAGKVVSGELAIFRVHDLSNVSATEFVGPHIARFSSTPGPHNGLGLDVYTRVTSPLRRVEDFIMLGLLRARFEGRPLDNRDKQLVVDTIRRLNQRIATRLYLGERIFGEDHWPLADETQNPD